MSRSLTGRLLGAVVLTGLLVGCAGTSADDAAVIEQLRAAGADLAQPRETRFYLYLPDEPAAREVAVIVGVSGRSVSVEPAAGGDEWLVLVTEMLIVDLEAIRQRGDEFNEAVGGHGGSYDGWEAAVSP